MTRFYFFTFQALQNVKVFYLRCYRLLTSLNMMVATIVMSFSEWKITGIMCMTVPVPTSTGMFLCCCYLNFTGDTSPDETKGCRTLLPVIQFDVFLKSDHCNIMHIFRKETHLTNKTILSTRIWATPIKLPRCNFYRSLCTFTLKY